MRRECGNAGVDTFRGLQIMIMLVKEGMLSKKEAIKTAENIHAVNNMITAEVLNNFLQLLEK